MLHNNYQINEGDTFNIVDFTDVENELCAISGRFSTVLIPEKADIVISFLKDHRIKKALVDQNETFIRQLAFSSLKTDTIESLFIACKTHRSFLADFESYIRQVLDRR